jgi:hypothetical protein
MSFGFMNKEEVSAMIEERRVADRRRYDDDLACCKKRHDEHELHRAELDKTMISFNNALSQLTTTLAATNATLSKWIELQPTVERSKNNFTTIDTLKSWGGSLAVLYVAYDIIKKFLG